MKRLDTSGGHRRLLRLLLVLPALIWTAALSSACGTATVSTPSDADVEVVFCLAPTERPRLVDAATALELAQPGSAKDRIRVGTEDMSLETWRQTHPADFDRSCAALRTASQAGQSPVYSPDEATSVLDVLLSVVVGALLAWLVAELRDAIARKRSSANAIRSSSRAFMHACDTFVRDWTGTIGTARPSDHQLNETRRELAAQLRHVQTLRPRWAEPRQLEEELFTHLGDEVAQHWLGQDQATRQERAKQINEQVRKLDAGVERVAISIERSLLFRHTGFGTADPDLSDRNDVEITT